MIGNDNNPWLPAPRRPPLAQHRKNTPRNILPSPWLPCFGEYYAKFFNNSHQSPFARGWCADTAFAAHLHRHRSNEASTGNVWTGRKFRRPASLCQGVPWPPLLKQACLVLAGRLLMAHGGQTPWRMSAVGVPAQPVDGEKRTSRR